MIDDSEKKETNTPKLQNGAIKRVQSSNSLGKLQNESSSKQENDANDA